MRYDEERWLLGKIERVAPALVSLSMQPVTKNSQRIVMIRLAILNTRTTLLLFSRHASHVPDCRADRQNRGKFF